MCALLFLNPMVLVALTIYMSVVAASNWLAAAKQ